MAAGTDQQRLIVEILRKLSPKTPEQQLKQYALSLQIANSLGAVNNLPRAQQKGGLRARHDLKRIAERAAKLAKDCLRLPSEALRAFEAVESHGELHPLMLKNMLCDFAIAASKATERVADSPAPKGRSMDAQARDLTKIACSVYTSLTGRRPARATNAYKDGQAAYGPLHAFLCEAFQVFKIGASADGQLKTYLASPHGKKPTK